MRERTTAPTNSSLSRRRLRLLPLHILQAPTLSLSLPLCLLSLSSVRRRGFASGRHTVAGRAPLASGAVYGGGAEGWRQRRPSGGGEEARRLSSTRSRRGLVESMSRSDYYTSLCTMAAQGGGMPFFLSSSQIYNGPPPRGWAHLHLATFLGYSQSPQTNTSLFCTICPHSCASGK